MISAFGAILLIAAGGYAGFSALAHLRTALRSAETILDASRDMRTEILCHRTPLPQLLERLGARYPRLFPDAENACMLVREFSFLSVWTASIRCAALPKVLEEEAKLDVEGLIQKALEGVEQVVCKAED